MEIGMTFIFGGRKYLLCDIMDESCLAYCRDGNGCGQLVSFTKQEIAAC